MSGMFGRHVWMDGENLGLLLADTPERLENGVLNKIYGDLCEKMDPVAPMPDNLLDALEEAGYTTLEEYTQLPWNAGV